MAQLAEHRIRNAEVAGSIPVLGNFCKKMPKSEPRVWLALGFEVSAMQRANRPEGESHLLRFNKKPRASPGFFVERMKDERGWKSFILLKFDFVHKKVYDQ